MRAYKFETKISKNGMIQVPISPSLYDKEVEVIIVPKLSKEKKPKAADFVNKWGRVSK